MTCSVLHTTIQKQTKNIGDNYLSPMAPFLLDYQKLCVLMRDAVTRITPPSQHQMIMYHPPRQSPFSLRQRPFL